MALDLSALEAPVLSAEPAKPNGKPMLLLLADIDEDPNQPRKEFTEEAMAEITASIKARGVKTPVSGRPHPDKPGKWILNYGARRYRGSHAAGKIDIPAFVDEDHNDYDQVIENLQRDGLKPMELALFIQKKLDSGEKKAAIARHLSVDASIVTQHLALIDPPACIEAAYTSGKCTSPKTLYELRSLYEKHPEKVEAWSESTEEITRKTVAAFADELKGKKGVPESASEGQGSQTNAQGDASGESLGHDQDSAEKSGDESGGNDGKTTSENAAHEGKGARQKSQDADSDGEGSNVDHGELTSWPRGKAVSDPDSMKKPLLLVEYDGRPAAVLLNRRPSTAGLIRIRFEDGGGDAEVEAGLCKINLLTEAEK